MALGNRLANMLVWQLLLSQSYYIKWKYVIVAQLRKLPIRQDISLVLLIVATLAMMVLPMPTLVADTLIAVNITLAVLMLMVSIHLRSSADFSTLPTVILITTIFRLSIEITTSRLVLTQADAGEIIRTFGEFVISGNVVVGLVVFLIISVVQFVVVTKGSERVAEVAARFALDAMPGKQMSIDTDVRNGDIKPDEARRRRHMLAQESAMHGAMDGAMKFVKGDAIAGLVIIAVNLIGGITIGCVQHGMSFSEAGATYVLLAVGDGLIAQIPALLISLTAGLIVTRVESGNAGNLGTEMLAQLSTDARTLYTAAAIVMGLAFIPGFPPVIFVSLAGVMAVTAWTRSRKADRDQVEADLFAQENQEKEYAFAGSAMLVQIGPALQATREEVMTALRRVRLSTAADLGINLPRFEFSDAEEPAAPGLRLELDRMQLLTLSAATGELWVKGFASAGDAAARGEERVAPDGEVWTVLQAEAGADLAQAGASFMDVAMVMEHFVGQRLRRVAGQFIGIQETQLMVARLDKTHGELTREALKAAPLVRLSEILRRLVEEGLSLHNMRGILEAVTEWAPREKSTAALVEYVRVAVRQQICHRVASGELRLSVLLMEDQMAEHLFNTLFETFTGAQLQLDNPEELVERLREAAGCSAVPPVIVTTMELRRPLWELLSRFGVDLHVLSHPEIAPGFRVDVVGSFGTEVAPARPALRPVPASADLVAA